MKKSITEVTYDSNFNYKFGTQEYTKKKMTPLEILDLAMAYSKKTSNQIKGRKLDTMIAVSNDLAKLTGGTQSKAGLQSGNKALILAVFKEKLVTTPEYKELYNDLVNLHKGIIKSLKMSSPEMRNVGGAAARAQAKRDIGLENINEAGGIPTYAKIRRINDFGIHNHEKELKSLLKDWKAEKDSKKKKEIQDKMKSITKKLKKLRSDNIENDHKEDAAMAKLNPNENITEAPAKLNYVGHAFKGNKIVDRTATKSYDDKVFKPFISGNEKAGNTVVIDAFDWKTKKIIRQVYKTKGGKDWNPKTEETHMNESLKKLKKSIELGSGKKGSYYVDKVGFDTNGNWSYMVSRGSNKAKKIQHQGDWGTKITKDSDWKEVENSKVAQNIINYYEKFVKESVNETISQSEKYKVYNTLKKGDEVEMDRRDGFKTYVVTKGKTILGKQKVERISLVLKDKPRAVKYYLYNRNKNIGLAIGDGASPLIDIRKSVNEANPKISMNNLDWGKSTSERNTNLDKYKSLKTTWGKNEFLKKLKGESVNETTFSIKYDNKSYSIDATDAEEAKKLGVQKFQIPMSKWTRLKITAESVNEAKSDFVARYSGTTITIKGARKKYSDDDLDKLYDILGKSIAKQKIKAKSVVVTAESINEEKVYIDYMDKKKGFATTRKKFNSMSAAIKWGKKNLNDDEFHPFNSDMIRFEMDEAVQTKSLKHFKKLKKQGVDVKLSTKADLNKEKVAEGKFEPDVIEDLRDIVKHKQNKKIKDPKTGKQMRVDLFTAGAIIKVYDAINQKNKASFVTVGIPKMAGMAFKLLK